MTSEAAKTIKNPPDNSTKGMYLKFMPYKPVIKVKGMKIVVIAVKTFMIEFKRLLTLDK